ncbi:hypothetical protein [uncultured Arcobacter sp.]|uniref:hypothetical protein n=1 Tax=uncultured Arcobacter sp. TaxID=165434 RepID=UPI002629A241|nr:hypothetical protein [uncultured Arcobacter sp.]
MIIIGDTLIPYEETFYISSIDEISNTKPNSTLLFEYDENILKYCFENCLLFGVVTNSLKESIYANSLQARYIICSNTLDKKIQDIAENYMFDSKVLSIIDSSEQIESVAMNKIDGVIYKDLLGKS